MTTLDTGNHQHGAARQALLSVIIPVYNTEQTLDRCLASVTGQDCQGMEIIVVDDGSTDGSPGLCDQWAARDSRISVVHKPNGGLSDARNHGIGMATGSLLTFVDSDDFLAPHTYSSVLADMATDCDIIEFPVVRFYGSARQERLQFAAAAFTDMADYWLRGKAYAHAYAWNKIFRRQLFALERFPKGLLFEDMHTLPRLLGHCQKVCTTAAGLYYYCDNPHGITATADGKALASLLDAHLATGMATASDEYYMHVLNIQLSVCAMTGAKPSLPPMRVKATGALPAGAMRAKARALNILGLNNLCKLYRAICKATRRW